MIAATAWALLSNTRGTRASRVWTPRSRFIGTMRASRSRTSSPPEPDETIDMTFAKQNAADDGFNLWSINDTVFSER